MPKNDCLLKSEEHAGRLLAYCAGRLDVQAANELRRHMAVCTACAAFGDSQSVVWKALDSVDTPPVSADFNRRLYARIEAADGRPWFSRWGNRCLEAIRPVFARPAMSLAAVAAVIVTGFLMDHPARFHPVPGNHAPHAVSASDAEQVEKTLDDLEMLRQFDVSSDQSSEGKKPSSKSL